MFRSRNLIGRLGGLTLRHSEGASVASRSLCTPHYVNTDFEKELAHYEKKEKMIKSKPVEDFIEGVHVRPSNISISADMEEAGDLSGIPEEHVVRRRARIFKPAREATQTAWSNTKVWKIELDNRERWENPSMGWASSGDPLSSLGMHMKFASPEDAVRFCKKNGWEYEVVEPNERKIKPKSYGENFSWNKKTRIANK